MWTFIIWGTLNACYFLPLLLAKRNRSNLDIVAKGKHLPGIKESVSILLTFLLTVFAWIFFRAENVGHAISYISTILSPTLFSLPQFDDIYSSLIVIFMILILLTVEWMGREGQYGIANLFMGWNRSLRWITYLTIISAIFILGGNEQEFIYFQF